MHLTGLSLVISEPWSRHTRRDSELISASTRLYASFQSISWVYRHEGVDTRCRTHGLKGIKCVISRSDSGFSDIIQAIESTVLIGGLSLLAPA